MTTRYSDHVIGGDHASRPAATAVPEGTTYSCTDHALEYQSDGATWSTRSTFGTAGAYTAGGTDVAVADGGTGASTASAARTNLGVGTGDSPEFAALNVGAATDTTITRTGAGEIAVEGNRIFRVGGADVPIADGGTGASTATAAFDALSPMTTAGDLIVGGASGTRTRLGVGSNGEILTLVAGTPSWEPNTGVADILDLPTAETDDTLVLAPDGAGGVEFRAEAGGGGSANPHNENDASVLIDATSAGDAGSRADHFTGTSLDAAWVSEATAASVGPTVKYSAMGITQTSGKHHRLRAYTPSGAFRVECRIRGTTGSVDGIGLMVRDSGTGDSSGEAILAHIDTSGVVHAYSLDGGTYTDRGNTGGQIFTSAAYLAIERNGSNQWTVEVSLDRAHWRTVVSGHSKTFTVAKVGYRVGFGSSTVTMSTDFFDVVS